MKNNTILLIISLLVILNITKANAISCDDPNYQNTTTITTYEYLTHSSTNIDDLAQQIFYGPHHFTCKNWSDLKSCFTFITSTFDNNNLSITYSVSYGAASSYTQTFTVTTTTETIQNTCDTVTQQDSNTDETILNRLSIQEINFVGFLSIIIVIGLLSSRKGL